MKEFKQGQLHFPKFLLISLTVTIAFFIPAFPNLDVGFQGFNVWHSFQYLGLTWYINKLRAERGELSTPLIRRISISKRGWKFYLLNVGFSVAAVGAIALLLYFEDVFKPLLSSDRQIINAAASGKILDSHNFYLDQCYYIVVLSFLLIHYLNDHLLFTKPEEVLH